jgi:DUF4097 and DUF4098 domain-containing protein YvlB
MQKTFSTPDAISLFVAIGSGNVVLDAAAVDETEVQITGDGADDVTVEQRGDEVHITAPPRVGGLFSGRSGLDVHVSLPTGSRVVTKLGSADLTATGELGTVSLKTGSGSVRLESVTGDAEVHTGSGDVTLARVERDLRVTSGSGDLELGDLGGAASVTTGSGSIRLGAVAAEVLAKTGSGDLRVREASGDTALRTGSGGIVVERASRGQLVARTGSGDVRVGIPTGVPVWTDIQSGSGQVHNGLRGVGEPAEGQDYLELRAKTGSGSVYLEEV